MLMEKNYHYDQKNILVTRIKYYFLSLIVIERQKREKKQVFQYHNILFYF